MFPFLVMNSKSELNSKSCLENLLINTSRPNLISNIPRFFLRKYLKMKMMTPEDMLTRWSTLVFDSIVFGSIIFGLLAIICGLLPEKVSRYISVLVKRKFEQLNPYADINYNEFGSDNWKSIRGYTLVDIYLDHVRAEAAKRMKGQQPKFFKYILSFTDES